MIRLMAAAAAFVCLALGTAGARAGEPGTLIVAGGCFWCVESDFDHIPGVTETISGYTGGHVDMPTYRLVTAGGTGHYEAVRIRFDPAVTSYRALVDAFWRTVDPLDDGGQFCDRGHSYMTAVFVKGEEQRKIAEASRAEAEKELGRKIVTPILDAAAFFAAEDYHQDYYKKNPLRYKYYRWSCGRNQRVEEVWGAGAYRGVPEMG